MKTFSFQNFTKQKLRPQMNQPQNLKERIKERQNAKDNQKKKHRSTKL